MRVSERRQAAEDGELTTGCNYLATGVTVTWVLPVERWDTGSYICWEV
jgi:hypothetical protein